MKFADILSQKLDMSKVKLDVLRPWISSKITQLLKLEDDVIEEYVVNQLEEERYPNAKKMQWVCNFRLFLSRLEFLVFQDLPHWVPQRKERQNIHGRAVGAVAIGARIWHWNSCRNDWNEERWNPETEWHSRPQKVSQPNKTKPVPWTGSGKVETSRRSTEKSNWDKRKISAEKRGERKIEGRKQQAGSTFSRAFDWN